MKIRTLYLITAIFFTVNAPIALLFPTVQLKLYGLTPGPGANYMAQWAGLGSVAVALTAWFARGFSESKASRSITLILMVYFVLAMIISILGVVSGVTNAIGWALALICLLFAISYYYFLRKN